MELKTGLNKPLKPAEFAERKLIEAILDATYAPGTVLPAERELAGIIGVTRATLRETLQRVARDGWITIRHGRGTQVNDYMEQGGLGILNTLVRLGERLPKEMLLNLLHFRRILFPGIALQAVQHDPDAVLDYLKGAGTLTADPKAFSAFDWGLQMCMARAAKNPIFIMMLNDFAALYESMGQEYFKNQDARALSSSYYETLAKAIARNEVKIDDLVKKTMIKAEAIWQETYENR